jgi:predicted HTH transcriptional regulator
MRGPPTIAVKGKINMNKTTNLQSYEQVKAFLVENGATTELISFIDSRIEMTVKKNARRSSEPTETQKENLELKSQVLSYIVANPQATSKTLTKHFGVSSQKLTPILAKLVGDNQVTYSIEKKIKYFSAC